MMVYCCVCVEAHVMSYDCSQLRVRKWGFRILLEDYLQTTGMHQNPKTEKMWCFLDCTETNNTEIDSKITKSTQEIAKILHFTGIQYLKFIAFNVLLDFNKLENHQHKNYQKILFLLGYSQIPNIYLLVTTSSRIRLLQPTSAIDDRNKYSLYKVHQRYNYLGSDQVIVTFESAIHFTRIVMGAVQTEKGLQVNCFKTGKRSPWK
ncbi:Hypothetical_protein [Hexamita inflata]|uniref:Hypothetical_protein n=1 Tax=Hexamita inflata TaxID=28002 RepID=A0AA86N9D6_9EUKA|nr:Hypothetical protein HINF_LOCUS2885 [Hexamita inflata]